MENKGKRILDITPTGEVEHVIGNDAQELIDAQDFMDAYPIQPVQAVQPKVEVKPPEPSKPPEPPKPIESDPGSVIAILTEEAGKMKRYGYSFQKTLGLIRTRNNLFRNKISAEKVIGIADQVFEETPIEYDETTDWGTGKSLNHILDAPRTPPDYLVERILSKGDKGFLAAQYKKGKTLLLMYLALCLGMGIDWLGFKVPKPRKVLYIRFELKDFRFKERLHLMVDGMGGRDLIKIQPVFEYPLGFEITKPVHLDWLKMMIDIHEPDALFLDPFYKLTSVLDIKDPKNAMPLLRKFEELRRLYKELSILFSHHEKKLSGQESTWDSTYGPMIFFADMDFEIKMNGGDNKFSLSFLSNDVPVEDIRIERDPVTLVHRFAGTESQNLRSEVMGLLRDEGLLPLSTSIEDVVTIESALKERKVRFSLDGLEDELVTGAKDGLYKFGKVPLTKKDGRKQSVKGYELAI